MTYLMNQSMNYEGVCRTAPATSGLLNSLLDTRSFGYRPPFECDPCWQV